MMFYRLTSKIGLVMMVLTFVLAALAVNSKRLFGVSFSDTMIELAIGATFWWQSPSELLGTGGR